MQRMQTGYPKCIIFHSLWCFPSFFKHSFLWKGQPSGLLLWLKLRRCALVCIVLVHSQGLSLLPSSLIIQVTFHRLWARIAGHIHWRSIFIVLYASTIVYLVLTSKFAARKPQTLGGTTKCNVALLRSINHYSILFNCWWNDNLMLTMLCPASYCDTLIYMSLPLMQRPYVNGDPTLPIELSCLVIPFFVQALFHSCLSLAHTFPSWIVGYRGWWWWATMGFYFRMLD